jgi:hypothetical protein
MFFRRRPPPAVTFSGQLEALRKAGFAMAPLAGGAVRVERGECAVDLRDKGGQAQAAGPAGILFGGQIAALVDGGFQKFFRSPDGRRRPATAAQLAALHAFEADLKERLGAESLYNQSLGTVSAFYLYDRLTDRDAGAPKRAWE